MGIENRREAIEAALDAVEAESTNAPAPEPSAPPPPAPEPPAPSAPNEPEQLDIEAKTKPEVPEAPKPDETSAKTYDVNKAPQSWKPAQKAKWDKLDPDVRQEVIRRERETERVLADTATARQIANGFNQVIQPFMARIQSMGVHPLVAAQELFKADYILTTAPAAKKAEFMAKLINDYGVDVVALDSALSGQGVVADPNKAQIDALLQERLSPFMNFIQQQQQRQQEQLQAEQQTMEQQIATMEADPGKFPEFVTVRDDMADIIELSAKKGLYLTLEQAYTRAVAINPEASQREQQRTEGARRAAAAQTANARAQRARVASSSVGGAPNGAPTGVTIGNDRRATIAAALDSLEGR